MAAGFGVPVTRLAVTSSRLYYAYQNVGNTGEIYTMPSTGGTPTLLFGGTLYSNMVGSSTGVAILVDVSTPATHKCALRYGPPDASSLSAFGSPYVKSDCDAQHSSAAMDENSVYFDDIDRFDLPGSTSSVTLIKGGASWLSAVDPTWLYWANGPSIQRTTKH